MRIAFTLARDLKSRELLRVNNVSVDNARAGRLLCRSTESKDRKGWAKAMQGINKLPSGRWQARYFAGLDKAGKRIYPSKSFLLLADATKWLRDSIREKDSGRPVDSLELTVDTYLDRWLEDKKQRVGPNTMHSYTTTCRLYIRPAFGLRRLRNIEPLDIQNWQAQLLKRISPRSVSDARNIFRMALKNAVSLRLIPFSPMTGTTAPKWERNEMKTFTREQARIFLSQCKPDRWGVLFTLMLMTGLRPGEAQGLCWSAVDLAGARVRVRQVVIARGVQSWQFGPPKTVRSKREVALPASLVSKLSEHRRRQLEERMAAGSAYENHDLVFANPGGGPLLINAIEVNFKKLLLAAKLPDMRVYDLRHSFCTLSILADIDLKTVSSDMGHASVAFTLDNYGHVLESMRQGAAQRREELFGNQSMLSRGK